MRIAMVSEHASPLAVLGGVDAGGQNVHVHARAGIALGSGVQSSANAMLPQWQLPEMRMAATINGAGGRDYST